MRMVWWLSILAGLNTFVAGSVLSEFMPIRICGMLSLIVASLQTATAAYKANSATVGRHRV